MGHELGDRGASEGKVATTSVRALYIHVPFCSSRCLYCDFDSRACRDAARFDAYVAHMVACINRLREAGVLDACRTAYIGGGTPSVLGAGLVSLVESVRRAAPCIEEFSCEANPESFTSDLALALRTAGATRVSLGVQSFDNGELHALGRLHDAERARCAVRAAQEAGLDVSIDLMCGIPLQTQESWNATLGAALALGVKHVSVYPLAIEEGTPLARKVARGAIPEPDEDVQAWCMETARCRLRDAGLVPYEVASYAAPGHACRHNIAYWTGVSYLGLGRSAASMLDRESYDALARVLGLPAVPDDGAARLRFVQTTDELPGTGQPRYELEALSEREAVAEDLMLGMRMSRGVGEDLLAQARTIVGAGQVDRAVDEALSRGLARWVEAESERRLAPTHDGWLLGNELYGLMWDLGAC
ncbi:hypothetical protein B5F33_08205 [Collinsella sp. An2]|nr:hypothetical protein B5F33_08205 [Collinsella sp. An2]